MINLFKKYKNKKVLVTGHTGFKGSWLVCWLVMMGAKVVGVSKGSISKPSHFELLQIKKKITNYYFDIKDVSKLDKVFQKEKPEFVFHMAAQALVSLSYKDPLNTFITNSIGVANILECINRTRTVKSAIIVTSDKCYKNVEKKIGYKEDELLAGIDPYSSSKSCAELIFSTYCKTIIKDQNTQIVSLRAGNVIGGGDWAKDRIIPDIVNACEKKTKFLMRNPNSTRPWQHVLEPLWAYLYIAAYIKGKKFYLGESYNVGPSAKKSVTVKTLISKIKIFKDIKIHKDKKVNFKESKLLSLNTQKIFKQFKIKPNLSIKQTADFISEWYKVYFNNKKNIKQITKSQIKQYIKIIQSKK
tara:strand:+ start:1365 stop:2435 length:1071 start_codon:yes stop_codon:yes gene_type:complete